MRVALTGGREVSALTREAAGKTDDASFAFQALSRKLRQPGSPVETSQRAGSWSTENSIQ
jgi:hypothetical protein